MLFDHENPEKSEDLDQNQTQNETPTPSPETSPENQVEKEASDKESTLEADVTPEPSEETPTPAAEETPSAVEESSSDTEEPAAEPETPAEAPVAEESSENQEETPSEPVEATPEPVAETPESTSEQSAEADSTEAQSSESEQEAESETELAPIPADLAALNPAVEARVTEILSDKGNGTQVLTQASIADLIHLIDGYLKEENLLAQAPKVGLVKRSYDTLKFQENLEKAHEDLFLDRLARFNKKRVAAQRNLESQRGANLTKKQGLLEQLKVVVDAEDPLKIEEVRAIQEEWKATGQVPKANLDQLYTDYRFLLDKFYKLREMHFELLDYDRKINLQEKERLIGEAKENLIPAEELREDPEVWHEKMDFLSELQQQWKSVGHVPREDMDRINTEYRSIIDEFFEIRQSFRAKLDELRQVNADKKVELLAKMEEYREFEASKPRAWNDAAKTFRTYQEEYKEIGQAPQAVNGELWAKYRDVCNAFYERKAAFFKTFDDFRQENLEKKKVLVEKAEEIVAKGEWERGAKELKRLQREWKEVGPVPERHSNKLWSRFRTACDTFFESRRSHYQELHAEEHENLEKKNALIAKVKEISSQEGGKVPEMIEQIKQIQKDWREIGKVPFKEKDKIWDEFRAEVDAFFNSLPAKRSEIRELQVRTSLDTIEDQDERVQVVKDRVSRLRRKIGKARETITQYQENMDRIARGKSGDALRKQIEGEIEKEKSLIAEYKKQITEFNEMLKNPPKKEETPSEDAEAATPEADASASEEATPTPPEEEGGEAPKEE